ncbi:hypothetical protein MMC11_001054 [Xylographa trunciseda]|nr:hypothetical protein [Xylographa trunciseda]
MKISQLYTYPIKSLRGAALVSSEVTPHGFPYDRRFMVLKVLNDGASPTFQNMTITYFPEMVLFSQELRLSEDGRSPGVVVVTHLAPDSKTQTRITIPLTPDTAPLEIIDVVLHSSPTKAHIMQRDYNEWFSSRFGYAVVLVYLGPHLRPVLGNLSPNAAKLKKDTGDSWLSKFTEHLPFLGNLQADSLDGITFADVAPYLIVTEKSLEDVSSRLPEGEDMDITKFRPNIVLKGSENAYEEDFWGGLRISSTAHTQNKDNPVFLELTQNCARCASLNWDYATGKAAPGESGSVLKKLMKDRRVDKGAKYSPIFGRYGFLQSPLRERNITVGDTVEVFKINAARTTFDWPGLGN